MKIAVVGEGPVGLTLLSYLLYQINVNSIQDLEISFIQKRKDDYTRRHIVAVNREEVLEIEKTLSECESCLSKGIISDDKLNTSILCFEKIVYNNIKKEYEDLDTSMFNHLEYDHVFLTDGFNSPNRKELTYNNVGYDFLLSNLEQRIFIFYYDIPSLGGVAGEIDDINSCHAGNKFVIERTYMEVRGIDFEYTIAAVTILYRVALFMLKINLWIQGFSSFETFKETLNVVFEHLKKHTSEYVGLCKQWRVTSISDFEIKLLDDKSLLEEHLSKYFTFVEHLMDEVHPEGATTDIKNKPFMIHSVLANVTINGLTYNDSNDLQISFAVKKDGVNIYLLGDSAIGYPPGYSLNFGLKNIFSFMPLFLNLHFGTTLPNTFTVNDLESYVSNNMFDLQFKGGYVTGDARNENTKSLQDIQRGFNSLYGVNFSSVEDFYNIYNVMNLITFYLTLTLMSSNPEFPIKRIGISPVFTPRGGGNKRRIKRKKRKKRTKRTKRTKRIKRMKRMKRIKRMKRMKRIKRMKRTKRKKTLEKCY